MDASDSKKRTFLAIITVSIIVNVALLIALIIIATRTDDLPLTSAQCYVRPNPSPALDATIRTANPIQGSIALKMQGNELTISLDLQGFESGSVSKKHGFHVHQLGDIVSDGCQSTKGHFNPEKKKHGDIKASTRHVGDWGNILVPSNGSISTTFTDNVATLTGSHGILGRAIVIHQNEDDLGVEGNEGSESTGNAGKRLACCVIVPDK